MNRLVYFAELPSGVDIVTPSTRQYYSNVWWSETELLNLSTDENILRVALLRTCGNKVVISIMDTEQELLYTLLSMVLPTTPITINLPFATGERVMTELFTKLVELQFEDVCIDFHKYRSSVRYAASHCQCPVPHTTRLLDDVFVLAEAVFERQKAMHRILTNE